MSQNQMGPINVCLLKTAIPAYSADAEFFLGMVKKWGLGFMINTEQVPGAPSAGSPTWAGLGNTYFWIDPARDVAGVIMMQFVPFADAKAIDVYTRFEPAVYATVT
jgi:methyl acetate hydrolase